ncbi:MAG: S9 family peptidase, partial [Methylocella sp.]
FIHIGRSQSARFAIISVDDNDSSECHLLDLADGNATPRLVEPRAPGLRYDVEHRGDRLFIRTNADGAEDFKIMSAPLAAPARPLWIDEVPHRRGCMIIKLAVYPDYLVRIEREAGSPRIMIRHCASGEEHAIAFHEEAYSLGLEERLEYATETLRFTYSSMTTPWETYDYNLATRERILRKRQIIPSGHDSAQYVTRRLFAAAPDGEQVPVSILYRAGTKLDGSAPLALYGYGAYGSHVPASFSTDRLSLADRGFICAIAHVRGGTDKGWHWYTDGKLGKKPNTFSDFITAARHLIAEGYTRAGRIVAEGGSAGGMLVGAAVNLAPELFAGVIADVPFVDVLNTMLDASLPLTPPEWLEWGNPITDPAAFAVMRSYSPYENVDAKCYPPILALGGLTDPRVTYWEPLKWVAKLRAITTGGGPILLLTNMGAGHGGAPGRFDHLEEVALQYAFALACVEGLFATGT